MKNWLAALGRLMVAFVGALVLLVAVAVLGESAAGLSAIDLLALALADFTRYVPVAATAALFLGAVAFKRNERKRVGLVGLSTLFVVGFILIAGGFALRRYASLPEGSAPAASMPRTGMIREVEGASVYIGAIENGAARKVFAWRREMADEKPGMPRLIYTAEARIDDQGEALALMGQVIPLKDMADRDGLLPEAIKDRARELLERRFMAIDSLGLPEAGIALAAFAFLAASLAAAAGLSRWPLAGFFLSATFLALLLALDAVLATERFATLTAELARRLGIDVPDMNLAEAALEAFIGLIAAALVLGGGKRKKA